VRPSDPPIAKSLAALVFEDGEDVNGIVADFARALTEQGRRLGGFIQLSAMNESCDCKDVYVLDVEMGGRLSLLQDLGKYSQSCRIDQAALAEIGFRLGRMIERGPDLLFINRFGKLEAEGKGVVAEIGAAAAAGIPTLVSVPRRYLSPWRDFTMGLDEELCCASADLHRWWQKLAALRGPPP
jgi:hypothetical protein